MVTTPSAPKCTTAALKILNEDSAAKKEIATAYGANRFLIVEEKIGSKSVDGVGSIGYKVSIDEAKSTAFGASLAETKIGKQLKSCDSSLDLAKATTTSTSTAESDTTDPRVELWVSRFGHEITEVKIADTSEEDPATATFRPILNKDVTIDVPTEFTSIQEITADIQTAITGYYPAADSAL